MPHRIFDFDRIVGDLFLFISLQVMSLEIDNSFKLQLSALVGSMLAVRTIDGKVGFLECLKVAVSGLILANFIGFFWCDYRAISLQTIRAYFVFFIMGFFSDIILRGVKAFGIAIITHVPDLTNALVQKVKALILK